MNFRVQSGIVEGHAAGRDGEDRRKNQKDGEEFHDPMVEGSQKPKDAPNSFRDLLRRSITIRRQLEKIVSKRQNVGFRYAGRL